MLLTWAGPARTGRLCGRAGVQQPPGTAGEGHASWAPPAAEQEQERLFAAAEMLGLLSVCAVSVQCAVRAPSGADSRKKAGSKLLSEQFM